MNWWTFRNTILWYHFVLLYHVFIRNIRIFEAVDFVFKEHLSCTVAVCRYIFERLSSTCVTKRYTAVLFVTRFMFILFGVGPASHTSSALLGSTWCHDIHLLRALQELYIYVCHAVDFYMMSAVFTYYALSRNLIFYARQCCIFLRDVIDINLLWAVQELDIFMRDSVVYFYVMSLASIYCEHSGNLRFYVRQCHLSTTWFHHTLRLSREIYMLYWCCLYINTLFNIAVLYYVEWRIFPLWIFTRNVYILTNMVLSFFDDRLVSAGYIWMWTCLSANGNWMKRV